MEKGRVFSDELIKQAICTQAELDEAIANGEKVEVEHPDGKTIAYIYDGKTYLVDIQLAS
jgi:hypothetical protein